MFHVYHLIDPRDKAVRYVGMTQTPRARLRAHIQEAREAQNTNKKRWIAGLMAEGLEPVQVICATFCTELAARARESAECHQHAATIFNIHDPRKGAKDMRSERKPGRK